MSYKIYFTFLEIRLTFRITYKQVTLFIENCFIRYIIEKCFFYLAKIYFTIFKYLDKLHAFSRRKRFNIVS